MARARRAASICAVRASSLCMRSISLFTRFNAAANTCLRCRECSAVPGKLAPLRAPFPRAARRFSRARVRSLSRRRLVRDSQGPGLNPPRALARRCGCGDCLSDSPHRYLLCASRLETHPNLFEFPSLFLLGTEAKTIESIALLYARNRIPQGRIGTLYAGIVTLPAVQDFGRSIPRICAILASSATDRAFIFRIRLPR